MSRTRPALLALLVVSLSGLGACGDDGGGASPDPEATTTSAAGATTTSVDPFTVPDDPADITVEYVEAVLTELERINGDALRLAVAEGMSPDVTDLLEAFLTGQPLADRTMILSQIAPEDFTETPGDIDVTVDSVVEASATCASINVTEDYRQVGPAGVAALAVRVELVRGPGNSTGWVVAVRDLISDGIAPEPCAEH